MAVTFYLDMNELLSLILKIIDIFAITIIAISVFQTLSLILLKSITLSLYKNQKKKSYEVYEINTKIKA